MKEIRDIINAYDSIKESGRKLALATVVDVKGSSYRRAGARMLVQDDGIWTGGISGGCLEGDALKKSNLAILKNKASVVTYDTTREDEHQIGVGLGCKGIIDVLMSPVDDKNNSVEVLRSTLGVREVQLLLTLVQTNNSELNQEIGRIRKIDDHNLPEYIPASDQQLLQSEISERRKSLKSGTVKLTDCNVFIEVLAPPLRVVLFGGNYDILPVLRIGNELGYTMEVVANPRRIPSAAHQLANSIHEKGSLIKEDEFTAFVLISHDYETDKRNLKQAIASNVRYIGMLGPAVRGEKTIDDIKSEGIDFKPEDHQRFYNPIGLDTGADNPEDIAISILSEIRAVFHNRDGGFLRKRTGTIYDRS